MFVCVSVHVFVSVSVIGVELCFVQDAEELNVKCLQARSV